MPTVMLVDDSEEFRAPVAAALTKRGFTVVSVGGGAEALRKLEGQAPDLVVLDMVMPGVDGMTVLRSMRQKSALAEVPVILLTAQDNESTLIRARELGAMCLLKYCITIDEICTTVRSKIAARPRAVA